MNFHLLLYISIVFLSSSIHAQDIIEKKNLFQENLNSVHQDPDQTIRVADFLLANATTEAQKGEALFLLSEGNYRKGNTIESIEAIFNAKKNLKTEENPYLMALLLLTVAERASDFGMDDISEAYINDAEALLDKIKKEEYKLLVWGKIQQRKANSFLLSKDMSSALASLKKSETTFQKIGNLVPAYLAQSQNELGEFYFVNQQSDSATIYFNAALATLKEAALQHTSMEATALHRLARLSLLEGNSEKAVELLRNGMAMKNAEQSEKAELLKSLSEAYKAIDSPEFARKYYTESSILSSEVMNSERKVRNTFISKIEEDQESRLQNRQKTYYKISFAILGLVLLGLILYYFYNRKLDREYKKFEKILQQIEKDGKLETPVYVTEAVLAPTKGIVIPESTEKAILERLEEFETTAKYTNPNMSLQLLAKQLKTNTKYLSEIIHVHKQKNFNTYINELRVNYIIHLLKTEKVYSNYKVSFLAETCGFSSHSAFTVVFKSITEFTPKQFISFLKKSKKAKSPTF